MKLFKLLLLIPFFGYSQLTQSVICPPPDSLGANTIRCDSMELNWISDVGTISSLIEWDTAGFTIGSGMLVNTANNSETIAGLFPNTAYDFYVKDSCLGDNSVWVGPFTFNTGSIGAPVAAMNTPIYLLNPTLGSIYFDATPSSGSGNTYVWDFGDGSPKDSGQTFTHQYMVGGAFNVTLIVSNNCGTDTASTQVVIVFDGSLDELTVAADQLFFPNPTNEKLIIDLNKIKGYQNGKLHLEIYSSLGQRILEKELTLDAKWNDEIDVSRLKPGSYTVRIFDSTTLWNSHVLSISP